jgi:hypothetical protein
MSLSPLKQVNKYIRDQDDCECFGRFTTALCIVCLSYLLLLPLLKIPCVVSEVSFSESVSLWQFGEAVAFVVASLISLTKLIFTRQSSNYYMRLCILLSSLCVTTLAAITAIFSVVGVGPVCLNAFG